MKIFVTGASGIVGSEVAIAFRRAGHKVYGLVRDAKKNEDLAKAEIILVEGDVTDKKTWVETAKTADVLIHAAADYANFVKVDGAIAQVVEAAQEGGRNPLVIYTSGVLVYPSDANKVYNENDKTQTQSFFEYRHKHEQLTLASKGFTGVVIRPGFVYGKKSTHFINVFASIAKGAAKVQGPNVAWSQIHADDLAAAYLAIAESSWPSVKGEIFNVADSHRITNQAVAEAFAKAAGYKGKIEEEKVPDQQAWLFNTVLVDSSKLTRYTKWTIKHNSVVDEAEELYSAWKAKNPSTTSSSSSQ